MKNNRTYESMPPQRPTQPAANEAVFQAEIRGATVRPESTGWDPYDVWRTRMKRMPRKGGDPHTA